MTKARRVSQAWQRAGDVEKSYSPVLNEKQAQTNYLLHVK